MSVPSDNSMTQLDEKNSGDRISEEIFLEDYSRHRSRKLHLQSDILLSSSGARLIANDENESVDSYSYLLLDLCSTVRQKYVIDFSFETNRPRRNYIRFSMLSVHLNWISILLQLICFER